MSDFVSKLKAVMVDAKIADINIDDVEGHGISSVKITLYDGTVIDLYARERNGGGYIKVDAGDDLVSE